ncbi:MAG: 50S ribosomal protein L25 [Candidatus Kuenenbacteria bacterium]
MQFVSLQAKTREVSGKKNRQLLLNKKIPAIIYGPKSENKKLEVDYGEFNKVLKTAGQSSLIELSIDQNDPVNVLVQDIAKDPVSDKFIHIDFYQLDMGKSIKLDVVLDFIGQSPAVKEKNAEIIKTLDKIEVECLPKDLVRQIQVDISELADIGDHICSKDIELPDGLTLVSDGELIVVSAEEIKQEIILESTAEEAEEKEGEEKKAEEKEGEKKDGEEGDKKDEDKSKDKNKK